MLKRLLTILACMSFTFAYGATSTTMPTDTDPCGAVKWYRDSDERNALYREIFRLSETVIAQKVAAQKLQAHQWGVVMDIDETLVDNSAWSLSQCEGQHPGTWNQFAAQAISPATPGAKEFTQDIHAMGGYVNLVSNRIPSLLPATKKDLAAQGIYFDQILIDESGQGTSMTDKNSRFDAIVAGKAPSTLPPQTIIAWFGDNIQDFPKLYQVKLLQANPNSSAYDAFGISYFILPNPVYGSWQGNAFN